MVTTSLLSGNTYPYAVNYLSAALKKAGERWAGLFSGTRPGSVDVVSHGVGGIITRAYVQSPAYGQEYAGGKNLPQVNNFVMMSVPNRGYTQPWNLLHDNYVDYFGYTPPPRYVPPATKSIPPAPPSRAWTSRRCRAPSRSLQDRRRFPFL